MLAFLLPTESDAGPRGGGFHRGGGGGHAFRGMRSHRMFRGAHRVHRGHMGRRHVSSGFRHHGRRAHSKTHGKQYSHGGHNYGKKQSGHGYGQKGGKGKDHNYGHKQRDYGHDKGRHHAHGRGGNDRKGHGRYLKGKHKHYAGRHRDRGGHQSGGGGGDRSSSSSSKYVELAISISLQLVGGGQCATQNCAHPIGGHEVDYDPNETECGRNWRCIAEHLERRDCTGRELRAPVPKRRTCVRDK